MRCTALRLKRKSEKKPNERQRGSIVRDIEVRECEGGRCWWLAVERSQEKRFVRLYRLASLSLLEQRGTATLDWASRIQSNVSTELEVLPLGIEVISKEPSFMPM